VAQAPNGDGVAGGDGAAAEEDIAEERRHPTHALEGDEGRADDSEKEGDAGTRSDSLPQDRCGEQDHEQALGGDKQGGIGGPVSWRPELKRPKLRAGSSNPSSAKPRQ